MPARPIDRFVAFDHSRIALPWFTWYRVNGDIDRLHRLAMELSRPGALRGGPARLAAALLLPLVGGRQIAINLRRYQAAVHAGTGVGRWRQLRGLAHTVFRRNAAAEFFYIQRFFRDDRLARSNDFLEHRELTLLLAALNSAVDAELLADKLRFHDFCRTHGLPTVPVWAVFRDGAIDPGRSEALARDPQADLFVKPSNEYRGLGVVRWVRDPSTGRYSSGGETLEFEGLCARLSEASRGGRVQLVQPRLREGPDLADLAGGAVCNLRIVTGFDPDSGPVLIMAALRMPGGDTYLTDFNNDVFAAAVDPATGCLGPAELKDAGLGTHLTHPDNGAPIAGRQIAHWPELLALAQRAHAACPWMPFVGWDVVDAKDGPLLLEANAFWGGNLAQMAGNPPLGATPFTSLYIQHLRRLRPDLLRHTR